jgi:hypothetical protein
MKRIKIFMVKKSIVLKISPSKNLLPFNGMTTQCPTWILNVLKFLDGTNLTRLFA